MKNSACTDRAKKKKRRKPILAWIQELSKGGSLSCLIHYPDTDGKDFVRKKIKCAKACGEEKPSYLPVKVTFL